jgi:hypothetical protein
MEFSGLAHNLSAQLLNAGAPDFQLHQEASAFSGFQTIAVSSRAGQYVEGTLAIPFSY